MSAGEPETGSRPEWHAAEREVEEYLLGGPRTLTRRQVAGDLPDTSLDQGTRLWNALGFASTPDDVAAFTHNDRDALDLVRELVADEVFGEEEALAVARTLGQSMARLAEWQATLLRRVITELGESDNPVAVVDVVERLLPRLEKLQSYAWRRHLAVTAGRLLAGIAHPTEGDEDVAVVGFADVVGFTRFSRGADPETLRTVLEEFESISSGIVARHGGRVIKTVGDEVMFVCREVGAGLRIAFDLQDEMPAAREELQLRVGLAHGEVMHRYGDVYGTVVNIASRLTSRARPGTVLVDTAVAEAARADDLDVDLRAIPPLTVRGYRHLRPHVARPRN